MDYRFSKKLFVSILTTIPRTKANSILSLTQTKRDSIGNVGKDKNWKIRGNLAGEGTRTLSKSLEGYCATVTPRPH
jgi:hypothetical protein